MAAFSARDDKNLNAFLAARFVALPVDEHLRDD